MLIRENKPFNKSIMQFEYHVDDMSPMAIKHKRVIEAIKYNPDTGIFTSRYKEGSYVRGFHDNLGYLKVSVNGKHYLAHRLAWFYMTGQWSRKEIDHINGNTSDNRFSNLREATSEENSHNVRLSKNNTSGARCVHFSKSDSKWVAVVCRNGKSNHLGRFTDKNQAIKAANRFLAKNDGEFFTDVTTKRNITGDSIRTIAQLKRKLELGTSSPITIYQNIFMENMLNGWGLWAYESVREKSPSSPLIKLMASVDGYGAIKGGGLVQIFESLHARGYKGEELFKKASDIIAAIKHRDYESCTDEEASFIDKMIIKTFGRNSPIIKLAVNYYVYGHDKQSLAEYIAKITNYELTIKQCRDRVKWCLTFFKEKLYASIEHETSGKDKKVA